MTIDDTLPNIKILIIGPSSAGKSALLIRYCDNEFDAESSTATIGVDFKLKKLTVGTQTYRLNLLDTAGQERFRTLSNSYYRNAHAVVLVYDMTSRDSFAQMERWFDEAVDNAGDDVVRYLVGAKADRADASTSSRAVTSEQAQALAEKRGAVGWAEVSSKRSGKEVDHIFTEVVEAVVQRGGIMSKGKSSAGIHVGDYGDQYEDGCAC